MLLAQVTPPALRTMNPSDFSSTRNLQALYNRGYWRWGISADMAPFAFHDAQTGCLRGLEIDIAKRITSVLFGCAIDQVAAHLEFVEVAFSDRVSVLVDHKVDSVIDIFADTAERRRDIDFAGCYMSGKPAVITLDTHETVFEVADLNHRSVAIMAGSSAIDIIQQRAPDAELLALLTAAECLSAVKSGQAQMFWGSKAENYVHVDEPDAGLQQFAMNVRAEPWKIAVRKDAADICTFINNEIAEMICSGTLAAIMNRWFRGLVV